MRQVAHTHSHISGIQRGGGLPGLDCNPYDLNLVTEKTKILVVDDEPSIVEALADTLQLHDYECLTALSGAEGLKLLKADQNISIVLTDIRMPDMDGLELCKIIGNEVTEADRDLAIILVTGHAGIAEAIKAIKLGALDFLTKPITVDLLVHAIRRADQYLESRALERHFKEMLEAEVSSRTAELEAITIKLAFSNQVKDEFLAMMSHELRTPLTSIVGFAHILEAGLTSPDQREFAREIKHAGSQLTDIITSMLDMVAVDTRTLKLNWSKANISDLIKKTIKVYRGKAEEADVSIDTTGVMELTETIDPARVSQAIGRLIDNAIKFSPVGGTVSVSARRTEEALTISIRDEGPGISKQDLEKVFEPLRQVDGSTTRSHGGIGVGLSLAKMLIELHAGSLVINSEPGQGFTATIAIPERPVLLA